MFAHPGLVPTMGSLHEGHLELAARAVRENDAAVASIFVNPSQFAPGEDYERYSVGTAAQLERDIATLHGVGITAVFAPSAEEMYPADAARVEVHLGGDAVLATAGESMARPGFFDGVATVCAKLFNAVQPTTVYFGQKDATQCVAIRQLLHGLCIPAKLVVCPTVRAADGLALSSRNARLTEEQRAAAPAIFSALSAARDTFLSDTEHVGAEGLCASVRAALEGLWWVDAVEYCQITHGATGEVQSTGVPSKGSVLACAVRVRGGGHDGKPLRLLDNVVLGLTVK